MTKLQVLYDLRSMLQALERELGLTDLSTSEKDVFLAAQSLTETAGQVVTSTDIRRHELVRDVPPATYHRALRMLLNRGFLRKAKGAKAKSYVVSNMATDSAAMMH